MFGFESPHLRANPHAALDPAELIQRGNGRQPAFELLHRTTALIVRGWSMIPWPETCLGATNPPRAHRRRRGLGDERRASVGMRLIEWLTAHETDGGRFSFTPVGDDCPVTVRRDSINSQSRPGPWATRVCVDMRFRDRLLDLEETLFGFSTVSNGSRKPRVCL